MACWALVTVAAGFVGTALCARLIERNWLLTRFSRAQKSPEIVVVGAIGTPTNWAVPLHQWEIVIYLAARVHVIHDTEADPLTAFRAVNGEGVGRTYTGNSVEELRAIAEQLVDDPKGRQLMALCGRALSDRIFSPTRAVNQIIGALCATAK